MINDGNSHSVSSIKNVQVYPHNSLVTRVIRNRHVGHESGVIWLTGLSGSGKSTIAAATEKKLFHEGYLISVLDGDTLRSGLNSDLDFNHHSRNENIRRAGEVSALFAETGHIVLASFISPHEKGRNFVKSIVRHNFYLVHIHADIECCIQRDPKGLYKKALDGRIPNFTGVSQSYEIPKNADLHLDTSRCDLDTCCQNLLDFIVKRFSFIS